MRPVLAWMLLLAPLAACGWDGGERKAVSSTRVVHRASTPIPDGTAPRGTAAFVAALAAPGPPVTPALLARGKAQFAGLCAPCHGAKGEGDGPVAARGFPRPPSLHEPLVRALPSAYTVDVITHGQGAMWPLAEQTTPTDRWAIAAHIRALGKDGRHHAAPAPVRSGVRP